jgi:hypothetical protein
MEEALAVGYAGASRGWVEEVRRRSALGRLAPIDHLSDPHSLVRVEPNLISRPAAFSDR